MIHLLSSSAFFIINKQLAKTLGFKATLLLADLISKQEYFAGQEWFFNTEENIKRDTHLSGHEQRKATDTLVKHNLVEFKIQGIPGKKHFKLNEQAVIDLLNNKNLKNLISTNNNKLIKIKKQDITNARMVRKLLFEEGVMQVTDVSKDLLQEFIDYWTEPNKSGNKMRYEMQKTWDLNLRLKNWCRNQKKWAENSGILNPSKIDVQLDEYKKGKDILNG